ncbi:unnamed protein product [Clavelina lepadiformis]|uniref:Uncharacterized protein n=1 Tax=Clavelina lepadiformis TaxID=159417 RepID=A0ABP0GWD1_CLALP
MTTRTKKVFFLTLSLVTWFSYAAGCHSPFHGAVERKKRQVMTESLEEVVQTRSLRDYFRDCLQEKVENTIEWQSIVDYTILDTIWYHNSDEGVCTNDAVQCWKDQLNIYLRPSSSLLMPAKECIDNLDFDIEETGTIVYRSREKRQVSQKYDVDVLEIYSRCISRKAVFPTGRRPVEFEPIVRFVRDHAICGDCTSVSNISAGFGAVDRFSPMEPTTSSSIELSPEHPANLQSQTSAEARTLIESFSSKSQLSPSRYEESQTETGCSSAMVYPFTLQGLTRLNSILLKPITTCNEAFNDIFLPDPCAGLINSRDDPFCDEQQSWCRIFPGFMNENCAKKCCEIFNGDNSTPRPGWTEWSPWGECPARCGLAANQTRSRSCPLGVPGTFPCIDKSEERRVCIPKNCPAWSTWGQWSLCDATCGQSRQTSERVCNNSQASQDGCSGSAQRSRNCELEKCLGKFSSWTQWSTCSLSCGNGTQNRSRTCPAAQRCQPDNFSMRVTQQKMCNQFSCPGVWSSWTAWSKCAVTCGGLDTFRHRTRSCINGLLSGTGCEGQARQTVDCGRSVCPKPQWTEWSGWTDCTWRRRTRQCIGGDRNPCLGGSVVYEKCKFCDRDRSYWSLWGPWGSCDRYCNGRRQRWRVCNHGSPGSGGCRGSNSMYKKCSIGTCSSYQ